MFLRSLKAAFLMPANVLAVVAGTAASAWLQDWIPLAASAGASLLYSTLLSMLPSFRRAVRANFEAQTEMYPLVASPQERVRALSELSTSQREHFESLGVLKQKILESYNSMPGGRVLAASSEHRLSGLLTSFLRLVSTLNGYRKFLSAVDRKALEDEVKQLQFEIAQDVSERLKEVKLRRVDILQKRIVRFVQAEESREVISHQLASIEDVLKLTHEQSIAIRNPEVVSRQLESLTAEVAATEETVNEMESFMRVTEEFSHSADLSQTTPSKIR
jgi:hypothetical protein